MRKMVVITIPKPKITHDQCITPQKVTITKKDGTREKINCKIKKPIRKYNHLEWLTSELSELLKAGIKARIRKRRYKNNSTKYWLEREVWE